MAIENIKNQPVFFGTPDSDCFCDVEPYANLLNVGDIIQFQLKINECYDSENICLNPNFADTSSWVYAYPWVITGGYAVKGAGSGLAGNISMPVLTIGFLYTVTFTVSSYVSGTLRVYISAYNYLDVTANGTYTITGISDSTSLTFNGNIAFSGQFDDVYIYEIDTDWRFVIFDSLGDYVAQIGYIADPTYFTIDDDKLTVTVNWEELGVTTHGCYTIGLLDPCINTNAQNGLKNYNFAKDTNWENGVTPYDYWSISAGKANYAIAVATDTISYFTSSDTCGVGISYSVTYTIDSINTLNFNIALGGTLGVTRTTAGTYTETIVAGGTGVIALKVSKAGYIAVGSCVVDNVILSIVGNDDYVSNLTSNEFKLGDFDCTLRINGCNDENGLGFNFETSGFTPVIRLKAALINATYPIKRVTNIDSQGTAKVLYSERRKRKRLIVDSVPERIHDFLSLLPAFDRFYIGENAYFCDDDEYNVIYNENESNFGSVSLEISETTQLIQNTNSGVLPQDCSIDTNLWIDENGNTIIDGADGYSISLS